MKNNKYICIIFVYVFLSIIVTSIIFINYNSTSCKLVLIDDKKDLFNRLDGSIPVNIEYSSSTWGKGYIKNSKDVVKIWNILNKLNKSNSINLTNFNKNYKDDELVGTISYLNGKKSNFYLGNVLKIDNYTYGSVNDDSEIMYLKNKLIDELYNTENLSNFINQNNKSILINKNKNHINLGSRDKEFLKEQLKKSNKITDINTLKQLSQNKGELMYQIRIYTDIEDTAEKEHLKTSNIININVYENNYSTVFDLYSGRGNLLYISGNMLEACNKIFNRY